MLEIAPGYGRWTHFLRDLCDQLVIVDIAESAIAYCRERFAADEHVSAYVNDGTSLSMIADQSIDLIFSFDSLVHAESDIIAGYIAEFSRVLSADGVAFVHHSNMGAYETGTFDPDNIHWRATSVSAALLEQLAERVGLSCISQETIAWGNETLLNDCVSVITRAGSRWDRENVITENFAFTSTEITMAQRFSTQYPPFRRDLKLRFDDPGATERAHAAALERVEQNERDTARLLLRDRVRRSIDPEVLNDLAVLSAQCGHADEALALLRAVVNLHPQHAPASVNLAALESTGPSAPAS
jgi:hypothetical protein